MYITRYHNLNFIKSVFGVARNIILIDCWWFSMEFNDTWIIRNYLINKCDKYRVIQTPGDTLMHTCIEMRCLQGIQLGLDLFVLQLVKFRRNSYIEWTEDDQSVFVIKIKITYWLEIIGNKGDLFPQRISFK